jgi:hypothetical protein
MGKQNLPVFRLNSSKQVKYAFGGVYTAPVMAKLRAEKHDFTCIGAPPKRAHNNNEVNESS